MPKMSTEPGATLGGPTMGTGWSLRADDPLESVDVQALQARCAEAVAAVNAQMSTWRPDSDLMRLNAAPLDSWVPLPQGLMTVLAAGIAVSRQTGGAFEMNVGDAVRAWGFNAAPIDLGAIRAASARPRLPAMEVLELDAGAGRARKSGPLALDLSGIAKGYGVDCLVETAQALGLPVTRCVRLMAKCGPWVRGGTGRPGLWELTRPVRWPGAGIPSWRWTTWRLRRRGTTAILSRSAGRGCPIRWTRSGARRWSMPPPR